MKTNYSNKFLENFILELVIDCQNIDDFAKKFGGSVAYVRDAWKTIKEIRDSRKVK